MKLLLALLTMTLFLTSSAAADPIGDTLASITRKGVLVAGVRDSLPPFGNYDKKAGKYVGYDIDYVNAIAKKLRVAVVFVPVLPETRAVMLQSGMVDIIVAAMTQTQERSHLVDFSHVYFITGQRFIARKGQFTNPRDFAGKVVGVTTGTTAGDTLKKEIPTAVVKHYESYPQALDALRKGEVEAVSTDEVLLRGIYLEMPDREQFEIPRANISGDTMGIAVRKGDRRLLAFINATLLEMEENGKADAIFATWFGPGTPFERPKNFNRR